MPFITTGVYEPRLCVKIPRVFRWSERLSEGLALWTKSRVESWNHLPWGLFVLSFWHLPLCWSGFWQNCVVQWSRSPRKNTKHCQILCRMFKKQSQNNLYLFLFCAVPLCLECVYFWSKVQLILEGFLATSALQRGLVADNTHCVENRFHTTYLGWGWMKLPASSLQSSVGIQTHCKQNSIIFRVASVRGLLVDLVGQKVLDCRLYLSGVLWSRMAKPNEFKSPQRHGTIHWSYDDEWGTHVRSCESRLVFLSQGSTPKTPTRILPLSYFLTAVIMEQSRQMLYVWVCLVLLVGSSACVVLLLHQSISDHIGHLRVISWDSTRFSFDLIRLSFQNTAQCVTILSLTKVVKQ